MGRKQLQYLRLNKVSEQTLKYLCVRYRYALDMLDIVHVSNDLTRGKNTAPGMVKALHLPPANQETRTV